MQRPEDIVRIAAQYGFPDKPLYQQYLDWAGRALHGDLGRNPLFSGEPVSQLIIERLSVTVTLAVSALTLASSIAIPLGVIAATRPATAGSTTRSWRWR